MQTPSNSALGQKMRASTLKSLVNWRGGGPSKKGRNVNWLKEGPGVQRGPKFC